MTQANWSIPGSDGVEEIGERDRGSSLSRNTVLAHLERALPDEVRTISARLREAGFHSWVVGGSVRDVLFQLLRPGYRPSPGDWDLATDARPEQVQKIFRRVIPTGIEHGTVTVIYRRQHFEVTTLRGETGYSDHRRPDEVFFTLDLEQDLARRDFTINAIAYDLLAQKLHDPFDGYGDLQQGLLRAVGDPLERFKEDGLRVMRCARFTSTLLLDVAEETRAAIRPSLNSFRRVASERIREEWFKALGSTKPSRCLRLMRDEGLLEIVAPRLFLVDRAASFSVACARIDEAAPDPLRRLAILCVLGFSGTPKEASQLSKDLASSLRFSKQQRERLCHLVTHATPPPLPAPNTSHNAPELRDADEFNPDEPNTDDGGALRELRIWLRSVGREHLDDVCELHKELAPPKDAARQRAETLKTRAHRELALGLPLNVSDLQVTGGELIDEAGLPRGPEVGRILRKLLDETLEDPSLNDRQTLLSLAKQLE